MLVAIPDGIFLWPCSALARRRGESFVRIDRQEIINKIACFYGPQAIFLPIIGALDTACSHLRDGRADLAQRALDRLDLPAVSPNGWRVMKAIAYRLGLCLPGALRTDRQVGTVWDGAYVEKVAALYDRNRDRANLLEKAFNPAGRGQSEAAQFKDLTKACSCGCGCSSLGKYNFNQDELRDRDGRWVQDRGWDPATDRSGNRRAVQLAQELVLPELIPRPMPIPLPKLFRYQPGLEISPFLDVPQTAPRDGIPQNPYPDRPECAEEWREATEFCTDLRKQRLLGKGAYRNMGKTMWDCILGQVSSDCGGNGLQA
jgi:hypothetical protein